MAEYDVFAEIDQLYGEPKHAQRLTLDQVNRFRDVLPTKLLDFWVFHGAGCYLDGKFWLCDPELMNPVMNAIFKNDPGFVVGQLHTFGYSSFGSLFCWQEKKELLWVDFYPPTASEENYNENEPTRPELAGIPRSSPDFIVGIAVLNGIDNDSGSPYDVNDQPLFPQALAKLGPLAPGEIYGFVPALQLGGEMRIENVRKVGVVEHLLLLAQLSTFDLTWLAPSTPTQPFGVIETIRQIRKAGP